MTSRDLGNVNRALSLSLVDDVISPICTQMVYFLTHPSTKVCGNTFRADSVTANGSRNRAKTNNMMRLFTLTDAPAER